MDEITLFASMAPPAPADADGIRQQARARLESAMNQPPARPRPRRRPLIVAGAVAAVAGAAASMALVGIGGPAAHRAPAVHVNLAAWSVNTNASGGVTFIVKKLGDPARLERTLAQAGVPSIVRFGEDCRAQGPKLPLRGVVSGPKYVGGAAGKPEWINGKWYPDWAYTVVPAAMPSGSRFMISVGRGPGTSYQWFDWALVPAYTHVACGPHVKPVVG